MKQLTFDQLQKVVTDVVSVAEDCTKFEKVLRNVLMFQQSHW